MGEVREREGEGRGEKGCFVREKRNGLVELIRDGGWEGKGEGGRRGKGRGLEGGGEGGGER